MQQPPTDEPLSPPVAGAGDDDDGSHAIPSGSPYVFSPDAHAHLTPYLAALHGSCITHDRMTGSFLPPLNHEKLLGWWKVKMAEVAAERRVIIILLDESEPGARAKGPELVGAVMLGTPPTETSPHCGLVESLLVSPRHRSRGGARMLLAALEVEAARRGRYLLRAETASGSAAEEVFKKASYQLVGKIPGYTVNLAGEKLDEAIFYKDLSA
ncbi:uncharacterized protein E0L32_011397 [Thyridium curvatum]|uniref:N-acetyltransferase domain-containing protein n=1 Tax=Thyridium curvatum TaxID=1093900 RepID=A0A507BN17_9PEZI|nr:uncharacterized protein E0L32_011397 [Thyridium curvatum]TPX18919.1 hypothetical protein E0L32_011397 [Thyridium curvatum]